MMDLFLQLLCLKFFLGFLFHFSAFWGWIGKCWFVNCTDQYLSRLEKAVILLNSRLIQDDIRKKYSSLSFDKQLTRFKLACLMTN